MTAKPHRSGAGAPMKDWYDAAGVRGGTRRTFHRELEEGLVFFPPELVPYLAHEAVRTLPDSASRELTVRHLYQFLLSATELETRVVNRGAELIAGNRLGFEVPRSHRLDAYRIYCDEGYHSLYSLDLADQIATVTGIPIPRWDYGGFVEQLDLAADTILPDEPVLAHLLQTVVFETLITAVLNEVPTNPAVVTAVRDVTRDHARDEGRHHRFFAGFFHLLWSQLEPALRTRVGHALPPLIEACIAWDAAPVRSSLLLAGLDESTADSVLRDVYGGTATTSRIGTVAQATRRMCESAGVLDLPAVRETFAAHGIE
ncbi:diiron oxygenase [Frankia sp. R43]|uniref:diiron oxygenase n=1 Tax=Frankia sp. R43 TaxID=269536 RepID=UPI000AD4C025|nr:diiron oxygenase [Frankia sp. R43]